MDSIIYLFYVFLKYLNCVIWPSVRVHKHITTYIQPNLGLGVTWSASVLQSKQTFVGNFNLKMAHGNKLLLQTKTMHYIYIYVKVGLQWPCGVRCGRVLKGCLPAGNVMDLVKGGRCGTHCRVPLEVGWSMWNT